MNSKLPLDRFPYPKHPDSRVFGPDLSAGQYVFVQTPESVVWVLPETEGHLHPKVLGDCLPSAGAGGLLLDSKGIVLEIDNFSGSFQFGPEIFPDVLAAITIQGGNVTTTREVPFDYD